MTHRTCKDCGQSKPFAELVKDAKAIGGHRTLCRVCQKVKALAGKPATPKPQPEAPKTAYIRGTAMAKPEPTPEVVPTVAGPRTHHYRDEYRPEPTFVRNSGLKHIKSKGF